MTWRQRLGALGVWCPGQLVNVELARTIEELGYGTLWLGGSPASDLRIAEELIGATDELVVATGIVNIWKSDAAELADAYHRIAARHPGRLLLGIGSGHRESSPERVRPLDAMARYLDVLDARDVPIADRVLSALGPRMLRMAAGRSAGTHPYLTVPAQTRSAREDLGPGLLVAPELTVVIDADVDGARSTAREFLRRYLRVANYAVNFERAGFTEEDRASGGSDRLVDEVVAHGDAGAVADAVQAHLEAGADHVCVQVLPMASDPADGLRALAAQWRSR